METRAILERLKNLKNAIANKSGDGSSECFHFYEKKILAVKYDLVISTKNETGIIGSFPAKDLIKGLEISKSKEVDFSLDDGENLVIRGESSKVKVSGSDKEFEDFFAYVALSRVRKDDWMIIPEDYMEGLILCAETASRDIKDGEVSCVAIKNKLIEATDDIRLSIFYNKVSVEEEVYLNAANVRKLSSNCSRMFIAESMVHFNWGSFVYSLPKVGVDFPDINSAVKSWIPKERTPISFPKELVTMAKDLEHFCGGDNDYQKSVKITFTPKEIKCSAKKDTASITKTIPNRTDTKKGTFKINPIMLSSLLNDHDEVFIHEDKIFFMRKNFIHVIGL